MIIKIDQEVDGLELYECATRCVSAVRMQDNLNMVETIAGWKNGVKGEWLVRVDGKFWTVVCDEDFRKVYRPTERNVLPVPLDGVERRTGDHDRRSSA